MSEKKTKYFKGRVKAFDPATGTADVVISDETKDRYDEVVKVEAFKRTKKDFMKHPVLLSSHAYRGLMNQIGMFNKLTIDEDSKEVVGKVTYFVGKGNPEADWGAVLAEKGIAAFSIGFISKKSTNYDEEERKKNGGVWTTYEDIELLEVSQVLVPANPAALQKSFGEDEEANLFLRELSDQIIEVLKDTEDGVKWEEAMKDDIEAKTVLEADEQVLPVVKTDEVPVEKFITVEQAEKLIRDVFTEMFDIQRQFLQKEMEVVAELKLLLEKKEAPVVVEESTEEKIDDLEEVLGPEKLAELKMTLFGPQVSDNDKLVKMFHDMDMEIKERLSAQS